MPGFKKDFKKPYQPRAAASRSSDSRRVAQEKLKTVICQTVRKA